jgi:hypothetical protein
MKAALARCNLEVIPQPHTVLILSSNSDRSFIFPSFARASSALCSLISKPSAYSALSRFATLIATPDPQVGSRSRVDGNYDFANRNLAKATGHRFRYISTGARTAVPAIQAQFL